MPFTNLLTNMVVLTMQGFGMLPTNTPAFEEYALHTMVTNAEAIAIKWNLDAKYMSTNNIIYELEPGAAGIWGYVLFGNRYRFVSLVGDFSCFGDELYDNFAHKAMAFDPSLKDSLTMEKALGVARSAMDRLGFSQERNGIGKPDRAEQEQVSWSDGKTYLSPVYQFEWKTDKCNLEIHVSGITSNVVYFDLVGQNCKLYYPSNYFEMLGLPEKPILVLPTRRMTNGWGPPYRLYEYQP
jgi:hypothetical protein